MLDSIKLIVIGFILGFLNSFFLKETIKRLLKYKKRIVVVISFIVRFLLIGLVFYIFLEKDYLNAILMAIGFTISNILNIAINLLQLKKLKKKQ